MVQSPQRINGPNRAQVYERGEGCKRNEVQIQSVRKRKGIKGPKAEASSARKRSQKGAGIREGMSDRQVDKARRWGKVQTVSKSMRQFLM